MRSTKKGNVFSIIKRGPDDYVASLEGPKCSRRWKLAHFEDNTRLGRSRLTYTRRHDYPLDGIVYALIESVDVPHKDSIRHEFLTTFNVFYIDEMEGRTWKVDETNLIWKEVE